jgi:hypothetical protein
MKRILPLLFMILFCGYGIVVSGTTGKISGQVMDARTGEPLPGVNIVITQTAIGAATNLDGFYYIINIPPGTLIRTAAPGFYSRAKHGRF